MTHNDRFEILNDLYHDATGYLRPGKSVPIVLNYDSNSEENSARFDQWFAAKSFTNALERIDTLNRRIDVLQRENEELSEALAAAKEPRG